MSNSSFLREGECRERESKGSVLVPETRSLLHHGVAFNSIKAVKAEI